MKKPRNGQAKTVDHIKFIDVWKKGSDGVWHIFRDISAIGIPQSLINKLNQCMKPKKSATASLPVATLKTYVGQYQLGPGKVLNVTLKGKQLYIRQNSGPAIAIYAKAKDRFFAKIVNVKLSFVRNKRGNVTALVVHNDDENARAARIGD